jgi:endoglucanase
MERMCPLATGLGSQFNETVMSSLLRSASLLNVFKYFQEFADAINYISVTKGAYALLDPHNYMRYGYVLPPL